jgi:hypothetical protein
LLLWGAPEALSRGGRAAEGFDGSGFGACRGHRRRKAKKCFAAIKIEGKSAHLGNFDSEEEAARARDQRAAALGKPVNFPKKGHAQAVKPCTPKYRGVTKLRMKWRAQIRIDGRTKSLGFFDSEKAAAR